MKTLLYNKLLQIINQKIQTAESAIAAAIDSRDNETKSSVGDKYETGRAMMQLEQQKGEVQLAQAVQLKQTLQRIHLDKKSETIELGSLVYTSNGIFFLSVGLGKLEVEEKKVFAISLSAPISKLLFGKRVGDFFEFRGENSEVLRVE